VFDLPTFGLPNIEIEVNIFIEHLYA
jgi:hypothetical protein